MLKKIYYWLASRFECMGQHKPEPHLTECSSYIYTHRCQRCKRPLGLPHLKVLVYAPPPGSTPEMAQQWRQFIGDHENRLRQSVEKELEKITQAQRLQAAI